MITSSKVKIKSKALLRTVFSSISKRIVLEFVIITLTTSLSDYLVKLAQDLQVLNYIRVLSGDKYEEKFFYWHVNISDSISLYVSALFA